MATTSDGRPLVAIKGHGKMRNYIEFCLKTLRENGAVGLLLRGEEKQLDKCVSVSELVKRRWAEEQEANGGEEGAKKGEGRGAGAGAGRAKCVSRATITNALAHEGGPVRPRIEIELRIEFE